MVNAAAAQLSINTTIPTDTPAANGGAAPSAVTGGDAGGGGGSATAAAPTGGAAAAAPGSYGLSSVPGAYGYPLTVFLPPALQAAAYEVVPRLTVGQIIPTIVAPPGQAEPSSGAARCGDEAGAWALAVAAAVAGTLLL